MGINTILFESSNKKEVIDYLRAPLAYQKLNYRNGDHSYNEITKYEDDDKICIVDVTYCLRMGSNGAFKNKQINTGLTFKKKGRSSSRLTFWKSYGKNSNNFDSIIYEYLLFHLDCISNYKKNIKPYIDSQMFTKGTFSMIACSKITTPIEFYKYYIKYSLRGYKISIDRAKDLITYYKRYNKYQGNMLLRTALYPNDFIINIINDEAFKFDPKIDILFLEKIEALNLKCDWSNFILKTHKSSQGNLFNSVYKIANEEFIKSCNKKYKLLIEISNLWNKGDNIKNYQDLPF